MSRRHTDLLDRLTVTSPCSEDWEKMTGNQQVRFCSHCDLSVHNLSEMTRPEALALVKQSQGRLCVRYYRRPDARVQTLPLHSIKRRASKIAAGAFTASLSLCPSVIAQTASFTEVPVQGRAYVASKGRSECSLPQETPPSATLAGTVVDPHGAAVSEATVTLSILIGGKTKRDYITRTNEEGKFQYETLPSGSYSLKVESPGFMTNEIPELSLEANGQRRLELKLEVEVATMGVIVMVETPVDALVNAASRNELAEVKELLAAGLDVNVIDAETETTALMEAVGVGNREMVRVLLSAGANVHAKNKYGRTAILAIREQTTAEVVWTLVSAGAKINRKDANGNTPLLIATIAGNAPVVQALIEAGAKVNAKNEGGKTALMRAAEDDRFEIVKALLAAGADVNKKDDEGATALKLARDYEYPEIVKLLEAYGARE